MIFSEIKQIVDRIEVKLKEKTRFEGLKTYIDERTDPNGVVVIKVENEEFAVDPADLKKILDKKIIEQDTSADEQELKLKAK